MRVVVAIFCCALALSAQKRPITHEDVWTMKRVGTPVVSPDGRWVVVPVSEPSYDDAKTVSDLWIVPADGSAKPRRLTNTKGAESGLAFAPDARRIAFTAKREGDEAAQVYVLPLDGGEAQRVTSLTTGAAHPRWRPDGKALLFQSRAYPGAGDEEANKKIAAERKARKYNARVFETFPIRYWDHWLDDLRPHLLVQELGDGGKAKDLLAGTRLIADPGFDAGGEDDLEAVWTPDGAAVVFSASLNRTVAAYAPTTSHLYKVAEAGGEPVALTSGPESYGNPAFRPDGKALYALHSRRGDTHLYSLSRLAMIDWPGGGAPKLISDGWDRSVTNFAFSPDSQKIYLVAEEEGNDKLFAMEASGGPVRLAVDLKGGCYAGLSSAERAAKTVLVTAWGSMVHPNDVAVLNVERGMHHLLTGFNDQRIGQIDWQAPKHFWMTAKNGKRVHSLIVLPPAFDPAKKYPLLLFPHGGPHTMTKDHFFVRWNHHLLTSPGYVLMMTNYTGSTGFGEKYAADIYSDILRGPGQEILEAAHEAIRKFSYIDGARQAAAGASYGGYLMNWFEGNTARFKCLVNHAGLTDNASMWGATDGAYYWETRLGGPVWERKGQWLDQSPSTYAGNFKTPMLVTHGEQDFRVPLNQALEIYKLLQRQQVPSRLVVFPEENHWVQKGENARYHMQEVLGWLKKWL